MSKVRPVRKIKFGEIQHRSNKASPHIVRWVIDGEPYSQSYKTKAQAQRYRSRLMVAYDDGERFDPGTGEPLSWTPQGENTPVYDWARWYLAEQWDELAPRTRDTYAEALSRFVPLVVSAEAPEQPDRMYSFLADALRPGADVDETDKRARWLRRWGLTLGDLDEELLAKVDRKLGTGVKGQPLAAQTSNRFRKQAKACVRRAVQLKKIPADPWPPSKRGRSRRKANRITQAVDIRRLPNPTDMTTVLEALPTKVQPYAGRTWQVMSDVAYYAGLRPSEVMMIRRRVIHLPLRPAGGWGFIDVLEADDGEDNAAATKTSDPRRVPIPPILTQILWAFLPERPGPPEQLIFRTEKGTRPPINNWRRALKRACDTAGVKRLSPYDLRHACATTWLQGGVSLGEAARRLGHSVQTLVAHYIQALTGDEEAANRCIESALGDARPAPVPRIQPKEAQ